MAFLLFKDYSYGVGLQHNPSNMKRKIYPGKEYKIKIGDNIRKWRNLKEIKQKEVAMALNLSEAAFSNIENNITNVTLTQLEDISICLDVPVEKLFSDPNESIIPDYYPELAEDNAAYALPDNKIITAVMARMQKKDEQIQLIMQNILHTMNGLMQEIKDPRQFGIRKVG